MEVNRGLGSRLGADRVTVRSRITEIMSRGRSVPTAVGCRGSLKRLAVGLLEAAMPLPKVRLLGISLSSLESNEGATSRLDLAI